MKVGKNHILANKSKLSDLLWSEQWSFVKQPFNLSSVHVARLQINVPCVLRPGLGFIAVF